MPGASTSRSYGRRAPSASVTDRAGGVDGGRGRAGDDDAVGGDALVRELLRGQLAQAADHRVAERARGERRVRLDQRHGDARVGLPERAGAARAGKAAADDHDARGGPLREGRSGEAAAAAATATPSLRNVAAARLHRCAAYQAAMAWISSSVNPLAMRSITVPARCPERKSCMALTIAARSSPASRGTGDVTRADAG